MKESSRTFFNCGATVPSQSWVLKAQLVHSTPSFKPFWLRECLIAGILRAPCHLLAEKKHAVPVSMPPAPIAAFGVLVQSSHVLLAFACLRARGETWRLLEYNSLGEALPTRSLWFDDPLIEELMLLLAALFQGRWGCDYRMRLVPSEQSWIWMKTQYSDRSSSPQDRCGPFGSHCDRTRRFHPPAL